MSKDNDTKAGSPPSAVNSKLTGAYPQKQQGMYMQRIKVLGGKIEWPKWRTIAALARKYSPNTPLHITTRQSIELHNVSTENLPKLKKDLDKFDLDTFGAGGDSVRNITVCTGCQFDKNATNVFPLAQHLQNHLSKLPFLLTMPRKFKISISGCQNACAKPFVSDLGLIAQPDGAFTVIGAGSLGPIPETAIQLYKDIPTKDILPLAIAAIEFFVEFGEYENRRKARFRHIRNRLGDNEFLSELSKRFDEKKSKQQWPNIDLSQDRPPKIFVTKLQLVNGNISTKNALLLADIAQNAGAELRININHGLELYGPKQLSLPKPLRKLANLPAIVACPGSSTCPNGMIDCKSTAEHIAATLENTPQKNITIALSGCPNNCAHSAIADIGLIGTIRKIDDQKTRCFQAYLNGGNGKNEKLAQKNDVVTKDNVIDFITQAAKLPKNL